MDSSIGAKNKSEILADEIAKHTYGDVISHTDIAGIIGEQYGTNRYRSIVQHAKNIVLEKCGYNLETKHGIGYKISLPDSYSSVAVGYFMSAGRRMTKGNKILSKAPVEKMSLQGKLTYRDVADHARMVEASMRGSIVQLKALDNPRPHPLQTVLGGV